MTWSYFLSKNSKQKNEHIGEFRLNDFNGEPTNYVYLRKLTEKQKEMVEQCRQLDKLRVV